MYRSVRHAGVPPRKPSGVVAAGLLASIFALRLLNSASVMSLVQHFGAGPPFVQGTVHALFSGVATMFVVVCRSHSEWRHTSSPSRVNVTSHSMMPAPMRCAAS